MLPGKRVVRRSLALLVAAPLLLGGAAMIGGAGAGQAQGQAQGQTQGQAQDGGAPTAHEREFPDGWFYRNRRTGKRKAGPMSLEGKPAPMLEVIDWIGEPQELEKLKGRVVVVDFWATWCMPCLKSIPKNTDLVKKYKDHGLVFIGVHDDRRGHENMSYVADQWRINYPIGVDNGGVSRTAWKVQSWPTYAVLDHEGVVRAAGLMPSKVEPVVLKLLGERDKAIGNSWKQTAESAEAGSADQGDADGS